MEKTYVSQLAVGTNVKCTLQVKKKYLGNFKDKPGCFLAVTLGDKTGELDGKAWSNAEEMDKLFQTGDFITVKGKVTEYNGKPQLVIEEATLVDAKEVDITHFLPTTPRNREELWDELVGLIELVSDPDLAQLLNLFRWEGQLVEKFRLAPAAKAHHQAYLGGLLEHTVNVVKTAVNLAQVYPEVNRDLLITGAIFHDIGKVDEFVYRYYIDYSDAGRLLGHIVLGVQIVTKLLERFPDFPAKTKNKLLHMIVSHHGQYEWQSPKRPKFLEAALLHQADYIDAQVDKFQQAAQSSRSEDGDWTAWVRGLERYVYVG